MDAIKNGDSIRLRTKMGIKKHIKEWESKDQSRFYAGMMIIFGWFFLSVGLNNTSMKLIGAGFCFGYATTKLNSPKA